MKKIIWTIGFLAISALVFGQGRAHTTLYYSVGLPLGATSDYIEETSFRGFSVYGDFFIEDEWSLGFGTGVQTYYEDLGKVTETRENITVTGKEYRYINQFPFLFTAKYHVNRFASITPHFGLGAGFYYNIQTLEFAGIVVDDNEWQFGFQPEAGLGIELSPSTDFIIGATYNYAFDSKDIDGLSSLGFHAGLRFIP